MPCPKTAVIVRRLYPFLQVSSFCPGKIGILSFDFQYEKFAVLFFL